MLTERGQMTDFDRMVELNVQAQEQSGTATPTTAEEYREAYDGHEGSYWYPGAPWPEPEAG
jgi:hypothetical protein